MLVGRETEVAHVTTLLEEARRGRSGALVVVGEAGLGKTALLEEARKHAADMRVLAATGVESESELPFASLHELLHPLLELLTRIPDAQARALAAALALERGDADSLAVNAGTLSLLVEAAEEMPVLVLLDDAHWVDRASAQAITFTARRLRGEAFALLAAVRPGLEGMLEVFPRLELGPLGSAPARRLLSARTERVAPADEAQVLAAAAGNPLALLELPVELADELPSSATPHDRLRRAFAQRLDRLSEPSRLALLLAASEPHAPAVRRAADALSLRAGLGPAEAAGLVRVDHGEIAFRHPVVRSLVYAYATASDRRIAHEALGDTFRDEADADRRAWHFAAAADEPDEKLAELLEETADRATSRAGHEAAARALERAARLSLDPDHISRRLTAAARAAWRAGDADRALELAEEALVSARDPIVRTGALLQHALLSRRARADVYDEGTIVSAVADVESVDPDIAAELLMELSNWRSEALDLAGAIDLVPRLQQIARRASAPVRVRALGEVAVTYILGGEPERLADVLPELHEHDGVLAGIAVDLTWAEQYDTVRQALEADLRDARSSGNRIRLVWIDACLAHLELHLGRLSQARIAAARAITLAEAHGATRWRSMAQSALAGIDAWQGVADGCRQAAGDAIAVAREARLAWIEFSAQRALGLLALVEGRPEDTIAEVAAAARRWRASTLVDPGPVAFVPDLVEAYALCGDRVEAEAWLEAFRAAAERARRRWALAAVARCEGLLADQDGYREPFERSLALLEASPLALDRARTQLAYGERLRRTGLRREARLHLRAAHEAFAAAAAAPWAERAAGELRATGESVGPRTPDRRSLLTPQELQIAHLVAAGKTNKEVAAQLYLSPKTIEYHLGNAYRKLDVHSRTELAWIVTRDGIPQADGGSEAAAGHSLSSVPAEQ